MLAADEMLYYAIDLIVLAAEEIVYLAIDSIVLAAEEMHRWETRSKKVTRIIIRK